MQWFRRHGAAVRALSIWFQARELGPPWSGGAAALLALTPKLHSLDISDYCGFFFGEDVNSCRRPAQASSCISPKPAIIADPLWHLTALESLTLNIDVYGPSFKLSQHLTKMARLTYVNLSASNDGDPYNILVDIPQLTSVRHLTLSGYLDMGPATLTKFCQLQTLHLDICHPDHTSFQLCCAHHFQHISKIRLDAYGSNTTLSQWIRLFEFLLQLPALQDLDICAEDLTQLSDKHWAFHSGLQFPPYSALLPDSGPRLLELDAKRLECVSHLACVARDADCLHQLPDGPYLKQLSMLDLSYPDDADF